MTPARLRSFITVLLALCLVLVAVPALDPPASGQDEGEEQDQGDDEVAERRTRWSRTVDNGDGSLTTTVFEHAVHFRDDRGRWQPIDSRLVETAGGDYDWRNAANGFDVRFKDALDDDFLRFEVAGHAFTLSTEGTARRPARAEGRKLFYADAMPGVDLRYAMQPEGVKETLVLADASVPTRYRFVLTPPEGVDVEVEEQPDGSWAFYVPGVAGPAFVLARPHAMDASGEDMVADRARNNASLDVRRSGGDFALSLSIDREWLRADERVFPVELDPTVVFQPADLDANYNANCSGCEPYLDDRDFVGTGKKKYKNIYRAALEFDLGSIPETAEVTDAQLGLYYDGYCISLGKNKPHCGGTDHQLDAHRMTADWTTSSTSGELAFADTPESSTTLPEDADHQWLGWDLTTAVRGWVDGSEPNHGVYVKRHTEPLGVSGPAFPSSRYANEDAIRPKLEVTYVANAVHLREPDTLHANGADLSWTRFTGETGDDFDAYEVHRGRSVDFTPDPATRLTTITDPAVTNYRDTTAAPETTFTYRIVTNGEASNARTVTLPADGRATKTLQPGPDDGVATFVGWFDGIVNCANYGIDDSLMVGPQSNAVLRGLVDFDLRDIPADATIDAATMSLWHGYRIDADMTVEAYPATAEWREGTGDTECTGDGATWYDRDGGVRWDSDGGDHTPAAVDTVTNQAGDDNDFDDFDVTSAVQQWVSGKRPHLGMLLRTTDEEIGDDRRIVYHSDDFTGSPALRPKLTVTYADGSHADGPTVTMAAPGDAAQVSGTGVAIEAAASDDGRVATVELLVDGTVVATDGEAPFATAWDSTSVANGAHEISARATDDAGNVSTASPVTVEVANSAPPAATVTSPAEGDVVEGTVTVTADAADDTGVTQVELLVDDVVVGSDAAAPYEADWDTVASYDGEHVLTARAYDGDGQAVTSDPVTVTVTNTAGTAYQAELSSTPVPPAMAYDPAASDQQRHGLQVTVTNDSDQTWTAGEVQLGYRWEDAAGAVSDGEVVDLPADVVPGGSETVELLVEPPSLPDDTGRATFTLHTDLFDTTASTWFGQQGNPPLTNPVIVNKVLATKLGLETFHHYDGEDLGAGMTHLANVANGNSLLRWTPFSSPGRGLSTVVDLTYNSTERHSRSPVGNGWSLSTSTLTRLGSQLDVHPNKADEIAGNAKRYVELIDGDGTTHRFDGAQADDGSVYWVEPPGVDLYLRSLSGDDPARAWALTRPDRVTFYYDADGYPTAVEDGNGNTLTFTLEDVPPGEDPGGPDKRVVAVTDAAGADGADDRSFTIDYWSKKDAKKPQVRGKIRTIADHTGSRLTFDYYRDGNLLQLTQEGGTTATGEHLADRTFVFTYMDAAGDEPAIPNADDRADPDPKTSDQSSLVFSVRDPRGAETTFDYYGPGSSHDRGKMASRTDRAGATTSYGYDLTAQTTTVAKPLERTWQFTYDTAGRVTSIVDALDQTTTLDWTGDNKVAEVTEPTGAATSYAYDDNGYLTDVTDQVGNHTRLTYEHLPVDDDDVDGKWGAGRTHPHLSQPETKTDPNGTATDAAGDHQWGFEHDSAGNLIKVTDPEGNATSYAYNADGTLATATDANGHATSYDAYDFNGLATRITDAEGNLTHFGYDADGLLRWIQDPNHADDSGDDPREYRTYFDYDSFHRLGRQSAPKSTDFARGELIWSAATYDANDNVVTELAPAYGAEFTRGATTTTDYDAMDRPTLTTGPDTSADPEGERTRMVYDAAGRLTQVTDPKGVATESSDRDFASFYDYDPLDRIVRTTRHDVDDGTVAETLRTHYCFDAAGDLVWEVAPRADVESVDCDAGSPPSHTTVMAYDAAHRLTSSTDPEGHTRSVSYDANGNVTATTDAAGTTTRRRFDQRDLPVQITQPLTDSRDVVTRIDYDAVGNRTRLITPRAFDAAGGDGPFSDYATEYVYDDVNRLTRIDLPTAGAEDPTFVHRRYDAVGNLELTTLPTVAAGLSEVADEDKTVVDHWDPGWVRTTDVHPGDPALPTLHFDHTAEGWQAQRTPEDADTGELDDELTMIWRYHADGRIRERSDEGGQKTTYTWDANNNLTAASDAGGVVDADESVLEIEAGYDGLDRLTRSRQRKQGEQEWRATTFGYDANANVVERVDDIGQADDGTVQSPGRVNAFTYDAADWLVEQVDEGAKADDASDDQRITNTYAPTGWEAKRVVERGGPGAWQVKQTTTWQHHLNGRLSDLETVNGSGEVLEAHDVSYVDGDGVYVNGHRTEDTFTRVAAATDDDETECTSECVERFVYDARDRLVSHDNGHATTDYTLDAAGNVVEESGPDGTTTMAYDGSRLDTLTAGDQTQYYHYTDVGNLDCVTKSDVDPDAHCGTATGDDPSGQVFADYAYDYLDRLTGVDTYLLADDGSSTDDKSSQYTHDALDRVVEQDEAHATQDPTTTLFDHLGLSDRVTREQEEDAAGAVTNTKSFAYDAFGHRIAMTDDPGGEGDDGGEAETFTYGYDVHGSVSLLLDDTGAAAASYGYTAYGEGDEALTSGDTDPDDPLNPYRYTGKRLDAASDTLDMGARRFGPQTGRFLQPDQFNGALADLGLSADPLTANRYSLAAGNPVSFVETGGHMVTANGGGGGATSPTPDTSTASGGGDEGFSISDVGGFFKGAGEGAWETVKGFGTIGKAGWNCAWDLGGCGENVSAFASNVADDPGQAGKEFIGAFTEPIAEDWRAGNEGEAFGRGALEAVTAVVAFTKAGKLGKLGKGRAAQGSASGSALARAGLRAEKAVSEAIGVGRNVGPGRVTIPGSGPGGYRVTDFDPAQTIAKRGSIVEVKDVDYLTSSPQLRDLVAEAGRRDVPLEIFTNARLPQSGQLADWIRDEVVTISRLP